jgi:hypothetical protein
MSLEQRIEENTKMIERLIQTLEKTMLGSVQAGMNYGEASTPLSSGSPDREAENVQREIDEAKKSDTPATSAETQSSDDSAQESTAVEEITYADHVKPLTLKLAQKNREAVIEILARFGVKRADQLQADQWTAYVTSVENALG